jgi:hypothetical protein
MELISMAGNTTPLPINGPSLNPPQIEMGVIYEPFSFLLIR